MFLNDTAPSLHIVLSRICPRTAGVIRLWRDVLAVHCFSTDGVATRVFRSGKCGHTYALDKTPTKEGKGKKGKKEKA